jgi:hypothetical protein
MKKALILLMLLITAVAAAQSFSMLASGSLKITNVGVDASVLDATSTVALFHFDQSYSDITGNEWALTSNTSVSPSVPASPVPAKFGAGSLSDATNIANNDWQLLASDTSFFEFAAGDFTLEFWIYVEAVFLGTLDVTAPLIGLDMDGYLMRAEVKPESGDLRLNAFANYSTDSLSYGATPPLINLEQWYHVCFERYNGEMAVYLDGVKQNFSTGALATHSISPSVVKIFRPLTSTLLATYYVDELRVRNEAVYQGSFTPPALAFGRQYMPALVIRPQLAPYPGIIAWYDGADQTSMTINGSTGRISEWRDKSGNGYHLAQSGAAPLPYIGSMHGGFNLNSVDVPTFWSDGFSPDRLEGAPPAPTASYTIYMVAACKNQFNDSHYLFSFGDSATTLMGANMLFGTFQHYWYGTTADGVSTGAAAYDPQVITFSYDGADRSISLSGVGSASSAIAANPTSGDYFLLGVSLGDTVSSRALGGYVAEILYYQDAHDASATAIVTDYLKNKWGL